VNSIKINTVELDIDKKLYKLLLDETGTYIYIKNLKRQYVYVNDLTQKLFQKNLKDIIGYDDHHFFELEALSDIIKNDNRVLDLGEIVKDEEINVIKSTGEVKVYQAVKKPIYNSNNKIVGLFGVSTDITEIYNLKEKLKTLAITDSMTKLYNRKYFVETSNSILKLAKRNSTNCSIAMFDLDNFKNINDTYGHNIGDKIIIFFADILQECTRQSDIISRWGGEEFLIFLPETNVDGALKISENIRNKVEKSNLVLENGVNLMFTVSIGVSEIRLDEDIDIDINSFIVKVDKHMYRAKANGKNRVQSD